MGEDMPFLELLPLVINCYGTSLVHGARHASQSLFRMLTLWFDFGTLYKAFQAGKATVRTSWYMLGMNSLG
jgi:hypothetical protein